MDQAEIRLRLIEAAARNPTPHRDGFAAGVVEMAEKWEDYILKNSGKGTLGLPKKQP